MADAPELQTLRLRVTPFGERHLHARYPAWLNDPEVVRFSEQRQRRHTVESCRAYWAAYAGTPHYFWAVERLADGAHVGNITATLDERNELADVGILLGERSCWGQGLGGEAWLAVCDFLLRTRGLRKVTGGALEGNQGMLRIMRRSGMTEDGRRVRHFLCEGREMDVLHFALFREDWLARHPQGPFPA